MHTYWANIVVVMMTLMLYGGKGYCAELQYNTTTRAVTGFSLGSGNIPAVVGHGVVVVADDILSTLPVPQQCQGSRDIVRSLRVEVDGSVTVVAGLQCFQGHVVTSREQLDGLLLEIIRRRVPDVRAWVQERCPVADITPRCQRFRAVVQRLDPLDGDIDQIVQDALTVRGQLP